MKQIKDYIHLYCNGKTIVQWVEVVEYRSRLTARLLNDLLNSFDPKDLKLILRPLSDMTEEEAKEIWDMCMPNTGYKFNHKDRLLCSTHTIVNIAPIIPEILYRGFDLFGLIEAGLAINAKDTQNKPN